jgi:hypothetical protein
MEDWPWPQGPLIDLTGDEDGGSGVTLDLSRVFFVSFYVYFFLFNI